MSESALWDTLSAAMGPLWEAQRHEPSIASDIPDVSYSTTHHGWIELKYTRAVPKLGGPVRLPHFTVGQRNWITRHGRRGGRCFVLWQIGEVYFLFGWQSARRLGDLTLDQLAAEALLIQGNGIVAARLIDALEGETPEGVRRPSKPSMPRSAYRR